MKNRSAFYLLGVLALLGLSLAAWAPLIRDYLLIDNDISAFYRFSHGANWGIWRLSGDLFRTWCLSLPGAFPTIVIILAHFVSCVLLFLACAQIWGNRRNALVVASLYCIYPWGYGLLTAGAMLVLPAEVALLWLAVLWLFYKVCHPESARWFELPLVAGFVIVAITVQDRLSFCYPALSAWAVWALLWQRRRGSAYGLKQFAVVLAPLVGFLIYTGLYLATKQEGPNPLAFHLPAFLSTFARQFRHFHHFVPLMSPGVWPTFVFYDWSATQGILVVLGGVVGVSALVAALRRADRDSREMPGLRLGTLETIGLAVALLAGAATVFVFAGGYSDEIYKRYAIGSILAFALCGFLSLVPAAARAVFSAPGKAVLAFLAAVFFLTDWLHVGVWRYEVRSLYKLADLIHRESLPVPAKIKWAHEPRAFWPQLNTMTEALRTGEPLTGDVQELYMEKFQLRPPEVSSAIRVRYTEKEEWVVEPNTQ
jgi:hypothetical protein